MSSTDPLETTLAGEHAAVYIYGVLGASTSVSRQPELSTAIAAAYATHRARRDEVTRRIVDAGRTPPPAAIAYALPPGLATPAGVRRAARQLEHDCAATYAWLVGSSQDDQRRWAAGLLGDAAVRGLAFGAPAEDFPGVPQTAEAD